MPHLFKQQTLNPSATVPVSDRPALKGAGASKPANKAGNRAFSGIFNRLLRQEGGMSASRRSDKANPPAMAVGKAQRNTSSPAATPKGHAADTPATQEKASKAADIDLIRTLPAPPSAVPPATSEAESPSQPDPVSSSPVGLSDLPEVSSELPTDATPAGLAAVAETPANSSLKATNDSLPDAGNAQSDLLASDMALLPSQPAVPDLPGDATTHSFDLEQKDATEQPAPPETSPLPLAQIALMASFYPAPTTSGLPGTTDSPTPTGDPAALSGALSGISSGAPLPTEPSGMPLSGLAGQADFGKLVQPTADQPTTTDAMQAVDNTGLSPNPNENGNALGIALAQLSNAQPSDTTPILPADTAMLPPAEAMAAEAASFFAPLPETQPKPDSATARSIPSSSEKAIFGNPSHDWVGLGQRLEALNGRIEHHGAGRLPEESLPGLPGMDSKPGATSIPDAVFSLPPALGEDLKTDAPAGTEQVGALNLPEASDMAAVWSSGPDQTVSVSGSTSGQEKPTVFTSLAANPAEQAADGVLHSVQNGQRGLTLHLKPESLGEVRINLISNSRHELSARLIAETPEAHAALESQMETLRQSLEARGVRVEQLSVALAGELDTRSHVSRSEASTAFSRQDTNGNAPQQQSFHQPKEQSGQPGGQAGWAQPDGQARHFAGSAFRNEPSRNGLPTLTDDPPTPRNANPAERRQDGGRVSLLA